MEKTRLVELLNTFNTKEMKAFRRWISSPYFNKKQRVISLLDTYWEYRQRCRRSPTKAEVYSRLFPEDPYNDQRLRLLISSLFQHCERFLVYQEQEKDQAHQYLLRAKIYQERQLDRHYHRAWKYARAHLEKTPTRSGKYFYHLHRLHEDDYDYKIKQNRDKAYPLEPQVSSIDAYFILQKLRQEILSFHHKQLLNIKYDLGLSPAVLSLLENGSTFTQQPAIQLYYAAFNLLQSPWEMRLYQALKYFLFQYVNLLEPKEWLTLLKVLTSIAILRYNHGERTRFAPELQELNEKLLATNLLKEMSIYMFKDFVTIGLANKKTAWVKSFIKDYQCLVRAEHRANIVAFAWGDIATSEGDYNRALQFFSTAQFDDLQMQVIVRIYQIIALYHAEEWDVVENQLASLQAFLQAQKHHYSLKPLTLRWISYTRRLVQHGLYDDKVKVKLREELEKEEHVLGRWWLEEQLAG